MTLASLMKVFLSRNSRKVIFSPRNYTISAAEISVKTHFEPVTLTPAEVAFANRLSTGANRQLLSDSTLQCILGSPTLQFENFKKIGDTLLQYFTREYLTARFPRLHSNGLAIGMQTFTANGNLALLARFMGLEAALGKIDGKKFKEETLGRCIKVPRWTRNSRRLPAPQIEAELESRRQEAIIRHADILKAILGAISVELGPLQARKFLDCRHYTSAFSVERLCTPEYPIVDLTEFLRKLHKNDKIDLEFRLLQESGRLSNQSMYFVGVFGPSMSTSNCLNVRILGEGYGASIALAQHRAACTALRNYYLTELPVVSRPSDSFTSISDLPENLS